MRITCIFGLPCGSAGKEPNCNAGDLGSIPGLGRSPGEGKGYPLQYSGLENAMDCIVHGVAENHTRLSDFHFHAYYNGHVNIIHISLYWFSHVHACTHTHMGFKCSIYVTGTGSQFRTLAMWWSYVKRRLDEVCFEDSVIFSFWRFLALLLYGFPCKVEQHISKIWLIFICYMKLFLYRIYLYTSISIIHLSITIPIFLSLSSVYQFSSVAQSCLTLCNPMDCGTPGLPDHHQFLEFTQTHVHWVSDAIQPSHPLSSPSPPAFNLSQHLSILASLASKLICPWFYLCICLSKHLCLCLCLCHCLCVFALLHMPVACPSINLSVVVTTRLNYWLSRFSHFSVINI